MLQQIEREIVEEAYLNNKIEEVLRNYIRFILVLAFLQHLLDTPHGQKVGVLDEVIAVVGESIVLNQILTAPIIK